MADRLTDDEQFRATTFHVIDFETTTPRGYSPEPIEVAVISLRAHDGQLVEGPRFTQLMRPPPHAPVTPFDIDQTGITPAMVADKAPAAEVLGKLDAFPASPEAAPPGAHPPRGEAGVLSASRGRGGGGARPGLRNTVGFAGGFYRALPPHGRAGRDSPPWQA